MSKVILDEVMVRFQETRDPNSPASQIPAIRQLGLRWGMLLRNASFELIEPRPLLIISIITSEPCSSISVERINPPTDGDYILMNCFVPPSCCSGELPEQLESANDCIFECVQALSLDKERYDSLVQEIYQSILSSTSQSIPFLTGSSETHEVSIEMSPQGPEACGGLIWLRLTNRTTGKSVCKQLFDYQNYMVVEALFCNLQIDNDSISVCADETWKKLFPNLMSRFAISAEQFFSSDDSKDWFLTDVTRIRRSLHTPILEPILFPNILVRLYKEEDLHTKFMQVGYEENIVFTNHGIVGTTGDVEDFSAYDHELALALVDRLKEKYIHAGYAELESTSCLTIEYQTNELKEEEEADTRSRVQYVVDYCVAVTGNGCWEGWDSGMGTMAVYFGVIDTEAAAQTAIKALGDNGLLDGAKISTKEILDDLQDCVRIHWPLVVS